MDSGLIHHLVGRDRGTELDELRLDCRLALVNLGIQLLVSVSAVVPAIIIVRRDRTTTVTRTGLQDL